tara:strand:+ start:4394 stop:4585 length:192 start_codon:yes stop_codon:yes gene_type:complete
MSDNAPYDDFLYLIDLTIESGDIIYIKNAIIKYENVLSKYYIDWGNQIIMDVTQEAIEEMIIT